MQLIVLPLVFFAPYLVRGALWGKEEYV